MSGPRTTASREAAVEDGYFHADPATAHAYRVLQVAASLTDTPCQSSTVDLWTSPARADRARGATLCGTCPILLQCRAYADAARPAFGVWAGQDRTS